ncbi:MAG TPA: hypothetical protein VEV82_10815 [Actinomycetota bacterium]|nr:hypothetical protein [Actinomycetota bacterium]
MKSATSVFRSSLSMVAAFLLGVALTGVATGHSGFGSLLHSGHSDVMDGTLTAEGFKYSSPETHRLAVPAAAFIHESSSGGGQVIITAPQVAPVNLPDGATVKKVQWYYDETASDDDTLQLEVWDPGPGQESNMVNLDQPACNSLPCVSSTTGISSPVINNKTHHYVLMLFPGPMDPVTTFKIVITYEVTVPD